MENEEAGTVWSGKHQQIFEEAIFGFAVFATWRPAKRTNEVTELTKSENSSTAADQTETANLNVLLRQLHCLFERVFGCPVPQHQQHGQTMDPVLSTRTSTNTAESELAPTSDASAAISAADATAAAAATATINFSIFAVSASTCTAGFKANQQPKSIAAKSKKSERNSKTDIKAKRAVGTAVTAVRSIRQMHSNSSKLKQAPSNPTFGSAARFGSTKPT